jgi:hypothetical protein
MGTNASFSFRTGDRLYVRYSVNGDENVWRSVFDTTYSPLSEYALSSALGQDIYASIRIPPDTNGINPEIVTQTATEDDIEYEVRDLMIETIG